MTNDIKLFDELLDILNKENLLNHLLIIGSWAEFLYDEADIINDFTATIKTMDIDFLIKNINLPRKGVDLIKIFEENNFEVQISRLNNVTKFARDEFEVEFLAKTVGKPSFTVEVPSLGIKVESLTHMGVMINNTIEVEYKGKIISIPSPEAFVIGKMIINDRRYEEKKEKDILSINTILIAIMDNEKHVNELKRIFKTLSVNEKKCVRKYIEKNDIPIDI